MKEIPIYYAEQVRCRDEKEALAYENSGGNISVFGGAFTGSEIF